MSYSENPLKRYFRTHKIPNDKGYLSEKLLLYKKNNFNKHLEERISKIRNITTKLNDFVFKNS